MRCSRRRKHVVQELEQYQKFLEDDLLPRANGPWRLGREKFARKLELVLDAGLTADEVLAEADASSPGSTHEMYVVARQLWSRYYPDRACLPMTRRAAAKPSRWFCRP